MNIISSLQGYSVFRSSPEDTNPPNGVSWPDLVSALNDRYKFSITANQANPLQPQVVSGWVFQGGELDVEAGKIPIQQVSISYNEIGVCTTSTENSDIIISDLIYFMNTSFQFKFNIEKLKTHYLSDVAFEFSKSLSEHLNFISGVENIINKSIVESEKPANYFRINRLAFSREDSNGSNSAFFNAKGLVEFIENAEFVIERRAGHSYAENRYFSRASMPTKAHFDTLRQIEALMFG